MTARAARFPLFDSLRALAALSVLGFHIVYASGLIVSGFHAPWLERYVGHLDVGVTIFFLISGFLLYRPFARARLEGEPLPSVGAYAWRRILRIVPGYWLALTVLGIWLSFPGLFHFHNAIRYYGFAQIYRGDTAFGGIGQAWTLCVEATFYVMLPVYALVLRRLPARSPRQWFGTELAGLAALVAVSEAYKIWAVTRIADPGSPNAAPYLMPLPNFLDDFAIGMGLAVAGLAVETGELRGRAVEALRRRPSAPWLVALAAFVVAGLTVGPAGFGGAARARDEILVRHALYALIALGVVLPAVTLSARPRGVARRVLALRPLLRVGLVSYGVYLWHQGVGGKVIRWTGLPHGRIASLGVVALITAASLLAAALSYYLVERPVLSLKNRWPGQPQSTPDQPGAVSAPATPPATDQASAGLPSG